mmetsp:Transcript_62748/g.141713  ORF Transcript_62748/g.141713 Transcript_62748/m.141713 type:complete len:228 (+) Transcript_62748:94-777(+)
MLLQIWQAVHLRREAEHGSDGASLEAAGRGRGGPFGRALPRHHHQFWRHGVLRADTSVHGAPDPLPRVPSHLPAHIVLSGHRWLLHASRVHGMLRGAPALRRAVLARVGDRRPGQMHPLQRERRRLGASHLRLRVPRLSGGREETPPRLLWSGRRRAGGEPVPGRQPGQLGQDASGTLLGGQLAVVDGLLYFRRPGRGQGVWRTGVQCRRDGAQPLAQAREGVLLRI